MVYLPYIHSYNMDIITTFQNLNVLTGIIFLSLWHAKDNNHNTKTNFSSEKSPLYLPTNKASFLFLPSSTANTDGKGTV